jgi:hypothetical protein
MSVLAITYLIVRVLLENPPNNAGFISQFNSAANHEIPVICPEPPTSLALKFDESSERPMTICERDPTMMYVNAFTLGPHTLYPRSSAASSSTPQTPSF